MMKILESIRCGFRDLREQPVSSFLAICGMSFGIAVTMIILSVSKCAGEVAKMYVSAHGGGNYLSVSVDYTDGRISPDQPAVPAEMYYAFANEKHTHVYGIDYHSKAELSVNCRGDFKSEHFSLIGCAPAAEHLDRLTILCGRFLTNTDCDAEIPAIVLPQTLAVRLFGSPEAALTQTLEFYDKDGVLFSAAVTGVYQWIDAGDPEAVKNIYAPYTAVNKCWGLKPDGEIPEFRVAYQMGALNESSAMREVLEYFNPRLAQDHLGLHITAPDSIGEDMQKRIRALTAALLLIAGLTYFVSCMGMVNVLLVSVRRKTMEIGVRKAIGANNRLIRLQFFTESMLISTMGCVLGIGLGFFLQKLLLTNLPALLKSVMGAEYQYLIEHMQFSIVPSLAAVMFLIAVTLLCGWLSGMYPAEQAMKLSVADALRFE